MTIIEMLKQSGILTVLGMTVVFVFLWIMVICINITGKLIHKMGMDKDLEQSKNAIYKPQGDNKKSEVTAAITAAITEFRKEE